MSCCDEQCGCSEPLVPLRVGPLSRRRFLQILGATGVAGLPGCFRPPADEVAPYVRQPDTVQPGNALHYATALEHDGAVTGLVVTTHEGRPTKVEGNPLHPASLGATGAWEQAELLELYNPARLDAIRERSRTVAREQLVQELGTLAAMHLKDGGAGLQVLLAPSTSPLLARSVARLKARFPRATVSTYRATDRGAPYRAARAAYGRPLYSRAHLDRADVVVSLGGDFISFGPERLRLSHELADRRTDPSTMLRLYAVESELSLTGAFADHRLAAKPSELPRVALALLVRVAQRLGNASLAALAAPALSTEQTKFVDVVAADLVARRGRAVALAGECEHEVVQLSALCINELVAGATRELLEPMELEPEAGPTTVAALSAAAHEGRVTTLLSTAFDPVYTAPADVELGAALARIANVIHLARHADHTSRFARFAVPRSHPFESWTDLRGADGTLTIAQPLISPLIEGFTDAELLSALTDPPARSAHALLREQYGETFGPQFEQRWRTSLQDGVVASSAAAPVTATMSWPEVIAVLALPQPPAPAGLELYLAPDRKVRDGELAHNPWMQECPDALTQLAWDNALLLNPATARALNVGLGDRVEVSHAGRSLVAPVFTLPGQAEQVATLHLGYGLVLEPGESPTGVDAYRLRTLADVSAPAPITLRKVEGHHDFAQIQIELSDQGRPLSMSADATELQGKLDELAELRRKQPTIFPRFEYPGYRWAMAIDLTRCVACNACVVACRAENNVPVVGREEVRRGREMHWLRVDRYFHGDERKPEIRFQPLMCVHCEDAPCEYVCPVNATVHSDEGLNEMVYNRCVGTRYCSNNCPYKVRRFNWHAYGDEQPPRTYLASNPDVTVRSRGVMEKCTYCVQRIERTRIHNEIAGQPIRDGDIQTACQQACPTAAIIFGSLHEPDARVSVLHHHVRRYDLLGELGTRPRTAYLARLTHKNPEL